MIASAASLEFLRRLLLVSCMLKSRKLFQLIDICLEFINSLLIAGHAIHMGG